MIRRLPRSAAVLATVALSLSLSTASGRSAAPTAGDAELIGGPYAAMLAASTDLGPSRAGDAQVTVTLSAATRPEGLVEWAAAHRLAVRWTAGADWAVLTGTAAAVAGAFAVPIRDFRGRRGQRYYASPFQPTVPTALRSQVTAVGRILSYLPYRMARPDWALDVPAPGLTSKDLLRAYNATPLAEAGYTGRGQTIVIFAFDGYDQQDLDMFADVSGLPRFTPEMVGGPIGPIHGETVMDLEVVHAIAPDARLVVINARPTVEHGGGFEKVGRMFEDAAARYPKSVWSLSIGWGCEAMVTAADGAPIRTALAAAHRQGIPIFDASGDSGGLECKGGRDWSAPPSAADIGVDAVAALPEVTSVGGTTLSTDMQGRWLQERSWIDSPLSQGSSGGVSDHFARPDFQHGLMVERGARSGTPENRLVPDVAAVADTSTGVQIVFGQSAKVGGGTSQAAPIWAGMTALMTQYVVDHGGRPFGDINPLLYRVAQGSRLPGFQDIVEGGNAVDRSSRGYDLVTGLGSPNVDNLARDLLDVQKAQSKAADYLPSGG